MEKKPTLAQEVYERLRRDIPALVQEAGTIVTEQYFCSLYGVSRTPVHEAFSRLCSEGMLEKLSKRGYALRLRDWDVVVKRIEYRLFLELGVAYTLVLSATDEQLESLRGALCDEQNDDLARFQEESMQFHLRMAGLTGNETAVEEVRMLMHEVIGYFNWDMREEGEVQKTAAATNRAHIKIIDALCRRDFPAAAEALRIDLMNKHE